MKKRIGYNTDTARQQDDTAPQKTQVKRDDYHIVKNRSNEDLWWPGMVFAGRKPSFDIPPYDPSLHKTDDDSCYNCLKLLMF